MNGLRPNSSDKTPTKFTVKNVKKESKPCKFPYTFTPNGDTVVVPVFRLRTSLMYAGKVEMFKDELRKYNQGKNTLKKTASRDFRLTTSATTEAGESFWLPSNLVAVCPAESLASEDISLACFETKPFPRRLSTFLPLATTNMQQINKASLMIARCFATMTTKECATIKTYEKSSKNRIENHRHLQYLEYFVFLCRILNYLFSFLSAPFYQHAYISCKFERHKCISIKLIPFYVRGGGKSTDCDEDVDMICENRKMFLKSS